MSKLSSTSSNSGNVDLDAKIDEWLKWDRNGKTCNEIESYVKNGNYEHLSNVLLDRITFGTAGLRGKMAAGYNCMNDLVIIQTGQGFLKHLEETDIDLLKSNGIVIGYDGRHNSKRFAELTATIFLHAGYPVNMFNKFVPTPFVPFTVTKLKCAAGVMVTASHNPKEDNGYKVYGKNGSQIISPADKNIQQHILDNLEPLDTSWDIEFVHSSDRLNNPLPEVMESYVNIIRDELIDEHKSINKRTDLKFVYSAMHGVGYNYIKKVFDVANLNLIPVAEQRDPDPDFPTVKFPNPEEGKSSLDLSLKTAEENNCKIIIANDPDADRMAAAEKDTDSGKWKVFTGNELGALLGWWSLHCHQIKNPNEPYENVYMLCSTVSSKILRSMAKSEGFNFIETLTGFKWMGNKAHELLNENKCVLFAFEEAIGFMCGSTVLDKDGISAAVNLATMASYLYHHGLSLTQQLREIYQEYGIHVSSNSYFICHDSAKIQKIFDRLRNFNGPNTYPTGILNDKYVIKYVRDLTTGYDNSQPDNKATLPISKTSQMITIEFENGLVATLRTSGTEPKIKYYTELCATPKQTDKDEVDNVLNEMVNAIVTEFLQPRENNLRPKCD